MIAEYTRRPIELMDRSGPRGRGKELLERCRPMASSALDLIEAMDADEIWPAYSLDDLPPLIEHDPTAVSEEYIEAEDPELEHVESQVAWHQLVDHLDPRLRRVIELRFYQDLSQQECARRMGVSRSLVSRLERCALDRLRGEAVAA
jgi:RNA polymerase sigma-B factor